MIIFDTILLIAVRVLETVIYGVVCRIHESVS